MSDPNNVTGSSFETNEEQEPSNLYQINDPRGLLTNKEQGGLASSQTDHRVRICKFSYRRGNTFSVNSPILRVGLRNNTRLAAHPRKISPNARIRPPRVIPSHRQPKQPSMQSIGGNPINLIDQFRMFPQHLSQNQLGIDSDMPSLVLLDYPAEGTPGTNVSLPTMPIGGNQNQFAHGVVSAPIRSRRPRRPPSGRRAPMQQRRGNAAVVIPTNNHPRSGDTERLFDDDEVYRRHEIERQMRIKLEVERLGMISEKACMKLPDTSSSLEAFEHNQVLCDAMLQLRGCGQLNNASSNPFEDLQPPGYDTSNRPKMHEQNQIPGYNVFNGPKMLEQNQPLGYDGFDGPKMLEKNQPLSYDAFSGPKMHKQNQFSPYNGNLLMSQTGHDDNPNKDSQEATYNLLNVQQILQHEGYLHNVTGPHGITHFAAPGMPENGEVETSNSKKAKQASQFIMGQIPVIAPDERPHIQQHDGSLSDICGLSDPLFLLLRSRQCSRFALPPASSDLEHFGSIGLRRSPNSSITAFSNISGNDQSGMY